MTDLMRQRPACTVIGVQIQEFRGLRDIWFRWADRTSVLGANGSGKTRLFEAFAWLMGSPETIRLLRSRGSSDPEDVRLAVVVEEHPHFLPTDPEITRMLGLRDPDSASDSAWWDQYAPASSHDWLDVLAFGAPPALAAELERQPPTVMYELDGSLQDARHFNRRLAWPTPVVKQLRAALGSTCLPNVWAPLSTRMTERWWPGAAHYLPVAELPSRPAPPTMLQWLPRLRSADEMQDDLASAWHSQIAAVHVLAETLDGLMDNFGPPRDDDDEPTGIDAGWWLSVIADQAANTLLETVMPQLGVFPRDRGSLTVEHRTTALDLNGDRGLLALSAGERRWADEAIARAASAMREHGERARHLSALLPSTDLDALLDDLVDDWDEIVRDVESWGFWGGPQLTRLLDLLVHAELRSMSDLRDKDKSRLRRVLATFGVIEYPRRPIWLVDEPEAHLHPHAQAKVIDAIERFPGDVVVATHQPRFLSRPGWSPQALSVRKDGSTGVGSIPNGKVRDVAGRLGITAGELLVGTAGILFVEGEHDRLILGDQFQSDFELARVRILRLHGVDNVRSVAEQGLITDILTDLPVAILVDNARLHGRHSAKVTHEEQMLKHLQQELAKSDRHVIMEGLDRPDIVAYLNEEVVRSLWPAFSGWRSVIADYRHDQSHSFKDWLYRKHRVDLRTTDKIQKVLNHMRERHLPLEAPLPSTAMSILSQLSDRPSSEPPM